LIDKTVSHGIKDGRPFSNVLSSGASGCHEPYNQ
jgi:hypothetical protein